MKKLLSFLLAFLPMMASAYDFEVDGLYFNILSSSEKTVEITSGDENYNLGEIILPSSVFYKNVEFCVVAIGPDAFNSATFDGITIPASIKTVGNRAFAYSSYYNRPYYICFEGNISINSEAFWCSWYGTFIFKNNVPPTLIDESNRGCLFNSNPIMCIPEGVNDNSFMEFASRGSVIHYENSIDISMLKSLALSQFRIDSDCFEFEITSLVKPYSAMLKSVKKDDTYITLPSSVSYLNYNFLVYNSGEDIFSNAKKIETLIIPEGYISMDGSIGICNSLKKIIIPSTIEKLSKTFVDCPSLEHVESNIQNPFETDAFNTNIISLFTTLYVPDNFIENYQSTSPWNLFQSILPLSSLPKYKLIYMIGYEVYKEVEYEYGATITPEPEPTKEGYTFSGWSEIPATMPAHDVTVTGTFSINTYKLMYVVDGQTYKTYDVEYGAAITPEPAPTKEGYTFLGWSEIPATMPAHDVAVTGSFTINSYKLTYVVDGETYKTYDVEYGAIIVPEPAPEKEDYVFIGWSEIPETMPAHDVTVYSIYESIYQIDGHEYVDLNLPSGNVWAVTNIGSTSDNGYGSSYCFGNDEYDLATQMWGSQWSTPTRSDFHELIDYCTWTWEEYNGYKGYRVTGQNGKSIFMAALGWQEGYYQQIQKKDIVLRYWTNDRSSIFTSYSCVLHADSSMIDVDNYYISILIKCPIRPVAKSYIERPYYTLTYLVDGEVYKSYQVQELAHITPEPKPTKEGYTFSGWSEIPATMPAHDVTVTGSFSINTYKLTYMVDNQVYKTINYDYGATITPEPAPEKEGYTFSGWSVIPKNMPAHDVTVTGTFSVNTYVLTYIVDGQKYSSYELEYGATITPEAEPTKEGYTFSGWDGLPETMPAHDVTVTGTFSINSYKLTYMIDDVVYKAVMYEYGATIVPEPQPDGDYISFEWVGLPETMPANDVTVYAIYETGIFDIMTLQGIKAIYAPNGKKLDKLQKGLNIVVMQDGTVRKVLY